MTTPLPIEMTITHWAGMIPPPTEIVLGTSTGGVYDCTGASAVTFEYSVDGGVVQTGTATATNAAAGQFRITWSAAPFAVAGTLRGALWFTLNGARIVAAIVTANVLAPPVPIH